MSSEELRLFAEVVDDGRLTMQFVGLPEALTGVPPTPMPRPDVVVLIEEPDCATLGRYTMSGATAGDTWHESVADAVACADREYGDGLGEWERIPRDVNEQVAYVLGVIRSRNRSV